ncbi:MAG: alcohol dehydrogenase catalytic domain-containing protein [Proteobacteria bacterium]|nr:alcohol dehydrogenase catalytic domain-containing protein [Pseudomonadota bacterium]
MKALQMDARPLRFAAAKTCAAILGKTSYLQGPGKTIRLVDIPEPVLPSDDWVKIRTHYCGFCGSDLNLITLHDAPGAQPFTSFPCILGHEFIGEIVETGAHVDHFKQGDRVAVNPVIGCEARGITPLCPWCQSGRTSQCENHAEGKFSPGMFLGITKDLNGGFAPFVVAHKSQLFRIPECVSPKSAVMTEPVSVALQTVLENRPSDHEKILIMGGGVIGNLIVQSIRALGCGCHISVVDPSPFAGEFALQFGADEIIRPDQAFLRTAAITGAKLYKPVLGLPVPRGGFHRVYDTVGNSSTVNLSLRLLNTMGTLSIVGIGSDLKIDPTTLWLKLQTIKGVYGYGLVENNGKKHHVFDMAMEFMKEDKIKAAELITHTFRLEDYRHMIRVNMNKVKYKAVKTIVSFQD